MKIEAWTLFSISLPRWGEGDSGTFRNSWENSRESQLPLKGWLIIMFGWSRQSHYGSGLGRKWARGFSEHRESRCSVQKKLTRWPLTVINTLGSSGIIRMGANLDSILKSRDITLPTKVRLVKAMVFPVVMYGCECWNINKDSWALKNWCFWTVVFEKNSWKSLGLQGDPTSPS